MLKYRLISFPLLLCLLGGIFYLDFTIPEYGKILFAILAAAAAFPMAYELDSLLKGIRISTMSYLTAAFPAAAAVLLPVSAEAVSIQASVLIAAVLFLIICGINIICTADHDTAVHKSLGSIIIFFLLMMIIIPIAALHQFDRWWFLFFILATKACDTGGYIAGMLSNKMMKNGNHKLAPAISPKKSWEGLGGGIVLSLAVGYIFGLCPEMDMALPWVMVTAFLLCLGSLAGDLTESAIKRAAGIKDSGSWIPGMGGILDVADSFIYNGPLLIIFYAWFVL